MSLTIIKEEIKKNLETNENKNMTIQNLWGRKSSSKREVYNNSRLPQQTRKTSNKQPNLQFSSVQFSRSVVSDPATPWIAACQASLSITNSWSSPKLMSIELMMPSSHLILCLPLLLLPQFLQTSGSFPMSQLFTWSGQSIGVSALASFLPKKSQGWFPSEWTDLLAVQGTL